MDLERDAPQRRQAAIVTRPEIIDLQQGAARTGRTRTTIERDRAPNHHLHEIGFRQLRRRPGRDLATVPEHSHHIGNLHHLLEVMRDEEHSHALADEPAQRLEKLPALLRRQYGRRFVEDDGASAADEHLQDLDALFDADGKGCDPFARIDLQAELSGERRRPVDLGVTIDKAALADFHAEKDVVGDRQRRNELEMLVHHADAGADRRRRIR